jgi:hypothetical protein
MKKRETFGEQIEREINEEPLLKRLCYQEELVIDVSEKMLEIMEKKKISRKEMAKKLSFREDYFDDVVTGKINIPIRMISDIFFVLGCKVNFSVIEGQ